MTTRREFLTAAGALAVGLGARRARAADRPPNVLVFITDDQSWRDTSTYGSRWVRTPHYDRLAREGVRFDHAYVASPSCSPSRAAMLTGREPWELGDGAILHGAPPAAIPSYPEILAAAGWHVGYTGKGWGPGNHRQGGRQDNPAGPAWNQRRVQPRPVPELSDIDYAANLDAFLKARRPDQPFCFWLGTLEPHAPFHADNPALLPYRYQDMELPGWWPGTDGVRRECALAYAEMEHADATLGRAMAVLEAAGELDRTLILVTADNGTWQPRGKTNLYDGGLRVPLIARWPGAVPAGRIVDDIVPMRDLAPTILEVAGVPPPVPMTGRGFADVLRSDRGGQVDRDRTVAAGMLEWHDSSYPMRSLRTPKWLLIQNASAGPRVRYPEYVEQPADVLERDRATLGHFALLRKYHGHPEFQRAAELCVGPRPAVELYDCEADPAQIDNLAGRPETRDVQADLLQRLAAHQRATGDPRALGRTAELEATAARIEAERREAERLQREREAAAR